MNNNKLLTFFSFIICTSFALLAGLPLLHPGMIPTHDGEYHVIRFYEFYKMLQGGIFYPRWAPDLYYGYGIPLFTYVYPLPNYIASLFHLFAISFIDSFKLNMLAASITGSIGMYLWSKTYWGKLGGIVSAFFYTYSPYHFVDIYIRGSAGEVWGLGLFPLLLWSLDRIKIKRNFVSTLIASTLCALVIFAHNILALIYFAVSAAYVGLVFSKRISYVSNLRYLLVFASGLGLSAIFWLPAVLEKDYVVGLKIYDITKNFADLSQLIIPSWGSDFFGSTSATPMSVQIGIANLLGVMIGIVALIKLLNRRDPRFIILLFFLGLFFLACFLMLSASQFFWKYIPFLNYFQFPWRLLSIVILCCSFLAGSVVIFSRRFLLAFIFIIIAFLSTYQYSFPAHYFMRNDSYYISRSNFIDGTNSVGNLFNTKWASGITGRAKNFVDSVSPGDTITYRRFGETNFILKAKLSKNRVITLNTIYFPGWTAKIGGKQIALWPDRFGRVQVSLPKGMCIIRLYLQETTLQNTAKWISVFFLTILLSLNFVNNRFRQLK